MKQHIVIIGGGPAGISAFIQLTKIIEESSELNPKNITISIIEKSGRFGPGLPYSTPEKNHILNLPANVMSPIPEKPDNFIKWLSENKSSWQTQYPDFNPKKDDFPPRLLYGIYIEHLAKKAKKKAKAAGITVNFIHDEVLNINAIKNEQYNVTLKRNLALTVNQAILCIGHLPSSLYTNLKGIKNYFHSPWPTSKLCKAIPKEKTAYILGSRLTAIDIALDLVSKGHTGKIVMMSRGGLLPCVIGKTEEYPRRFLTFETIYKLTLEDLKPIPLNKILELFWQELKAAEKIEINRNAVLKPTKTPTEWLKAEIAAAKSSSPRAWQSLLFSLYPIVPYIWRALSTEDKKIFLRDYFSIFMTYLAAFPLKNAEKILTLLENGQLEVKGGLNAVMHNDGKNDFTITFENGSNISAKYLINATGPGYEIASTDNLLLKNMLNNDLIQLHPFGGIAVNRQTSQVLDKFDQPAAGLYAAGEITRGVFLATTDLGQTVGHVQGVTHVLGQALIKAEKTHQLRNEALALTGKKQHNGKITCISCRNRRNSAFWRQRHPKKRSSFTSNRTRAKLPKNTINEDTITQVKQPEEKTQGKNKGKEVKYQGYRV